MPSTNCKQVTKFHSHILWLDASKQATNSVTMVEEATRVYLADFQEIAPPTKIYMYPNVEHLLSFHSAKSESE